MIAAVSSSTAILASADIEATLAYYKNVLGFDSTWTWGDPPSFGGASMGGVSIMFNLDPDLAERIRGHQHWIQVDDADKLYRLHQRNNAKIASEIEDKPWGVREYVVEDINGYHLRISGPPFGSPVKSQPFPEGVKIERSKPAIEEYIKVATQAFGYKEAVPGLLECTWNGVIAKSPGGEIIGVLRIMQDAPGWFSIWDVAVVPDWQARRIGSAMMKEALDMVHEASPGANVYLFTVKHGFYERLGFTEQAVSLRKV